MVFCSKSYTSTVCTSGQWKGKCRLLPGGNQSFSILLSCLSVIWNEKRKKLKQKSTLVMLSVFSIDVVVSLLEWADMYITTVLRHLFCPWCDQPFEQKDVFLIITNLKALLKTETWIFFCHRCTITPPLHHFPLAGELRRAHLDLCPLCTSCH